MLLRWLLLQPLAVAVARVLLFWPVDDSERTQRLIKANVRHAEEQKIEFEVILAHYRGFKENWDQEWYQKYVVQSLNGTGYKFHFLRSAYLKQAEAWDKRYEFIWALDSDIDISRADLSQFLEIARALDSLIIGPTFLEGKTGPSFLQERLFTSAGARTQPKADQALALGGFGLNKMQRPNPACDYRHTDFVELTAPLLKSAAYRSILGCEDCISQTSDWGLDTFLLLKYVAERHGCALVDKTPVIHLDWSLARINAGFYLSFLSMRARFQKNWTRYKVLDCQRLGLGPQIAAKQLRAKAIA
ncbi:unnamed protein product [Durusdinium trenchii]|uniref:Tartrate-resistant acid phosphatase type 5 n=2 Tax=Durusdinium trenchii TaxID=1381693 RepID=A0ABP0RGR1_9DINO